MAQKTTNNIPETNRIANLIEGVSDPDILVDLAEMISQRTPLKMT